MGKRAVVEEHFDSVYEFLQTSNKRKNNDAMNGQHSSHETGDKSWYGTKNYEEAEDLFRNGYKEILPKVLDAVNSAEKLHYDTSPVPKMIPKTQMVGYAPNVPNAIMGIPESMINTDRITHKTKTINLIYSCSINCNVSADQIVKAGTAMLAAIKVIENSGIFINLEVSPMTSYTDKTLAMPLITLKKYHERLDIQKLCFPVAHPSMLRRFGFKWLETSPDITDRGYRNGYGRSITEVKEALDMMVFHGNTRFINIHWIIQHNYSIPDIISYLKDDLVK